MTPQHEEALRYLRLAHRDAVAFRHDDDAMTDLVSLQKSTLWVDRVLVWAGRVCRRGIAELNLF